MTRNEWLGSLKAGDEIAVCKTGIERYSVCKVDRVTQTLIILEDGRRFRKHNGHQLAELGRFNVCIIEPLTSEIKAHMRKNYLIRKIETTFIRDLSLSALEKIYEVIFVDKIQSK